MALNTSNMLQLLGVIVTAVGVCAACYKRRRIIAAARWLVSIARNSRTRKTHANRQQAFELPELRSWEEPDVEAGAATSAWGEEARDEIDGCCA